MGEDIILSSSRRHYSAVSVTYVDCYVLTKESLNKILATGKFPILKKQIRKAAIKLAFVRELIKYAALYKFAKVHGYRVTSEQCMNAIRSTRGQGLSHHKDILQGIMATSKEKVKVIKRVKEAELTPQQRMMNAMRDSGYLDVKSDETGERISREDIVVEDIRGEEHGHNQSLEIIKEYNDNSAEWAFGKSTSKVVPIASVLPVETKGGVDEDEDGVGALPRRMKGNGKKSPHKALTSTILSRPSRARGFVDDRLMDQLHKQEAILSAQLQAMEKRLAQTEKTLSDTINVNFRLQVLLMLVILVSVFVRPLF